MFLPDKISVIIFVIEFLILQVNPVAAVSWQMMMKPAVGHIKPNGSITVMCRANTKLTGCQFKVGNGFVTADMDFSEGKHSMDVIPKDGDKDLFTAKYTGTGLDNGQCGITLDRVQNGLYLIGCRAQAEFGSRLQEFMSLAADDLKPFKLESQPRFKVVEPGKDVHLLCSTPNKQPLSQCSFKLASIGWITFNKGHSSPEAGRYQYSGRGLEKGHCGVKLSNVTEADSGVIWCSGVTTGTLQFRAITLRVAKIKAVVELTVENTQLAAGERLVAKCSVQGVYPLPSIAWHLGGELIRQDDIDDTPYGKANYQWLWDIQTVSQELVKEITSGVANKELTCSIVSNIPVANDSAQLGDVKPNCGYRTYAEYDADFDADTMHKIKKRETGAPVGGENKPGKGGEDCLTASGCESNRKIDSDTKKKTRPTARGKKNPGKGGKGGKGCPTNSDCETKEIIQKASPAVVKPENLDDNYTEESKFYNLEGDYEDFDANVRISGGTSIVTQANLKSNLRLAGGIAVISNKPNEQNFRHGEVNVPGKNGFLGFPWHAALYRRLGKVGTESYILDCGGTLISKKHVVTAAHCVWDDALIKPKSASIYTIVLGKVFREWIKQDGAVQRRDVAQIHVHPNFRGRRNNFQFDVAIVEIKQDAQFTARVNVACVDWSGEFEEEQLQTGSAGVVTGWGYTEDEELSEVLRFVELPYMEPGDCFAKVDDDMKKMMTADKFCAGFINANTSVCPGDSGGGLLFIQTTFDAYYLRGIVSVSFRPPGYMGKCFMSEVTGFTSISQSIKWIKSVTKIGS